MLDHDLIQLLAFMNLQEDMLCHESSAYVQQPQHHRVHNIHLTEGSVAPICKPLTLFFCMVWRIHLESTVKA